MNNHQQLSLETSLSDSKQSGRSRLKVAVFSVLAVHVAGLTALLLTQGCKREVPMEEPQLEPPILDTNLTYYTETNLPPTLPPELPPEIPGYPPPPGQLGGEVPPNVPPVPVVSEYVVKSGDSFYSIAKQYGTTIKAIEAANPGVDSRRLKIGQKLVLPAPDSTGSAPAVVPAVSGENIYVVKSGDTLTRIAARNQTTVKELKALNGLVTDRINVGQKLKLPPPPAPSPVPMVEPLPAPPLAPAPAPGQ